MRPEVGFRDATEMAKPAINLVLQQLRRWVGTSIEPDSHDSALLQRFVTQRDEEAFAALVDRHGPAILGVCRQVLGDDHAAADAFQATFLILARKAASIRKQTSLAVWLHRVAGNVARTARTSAARRRHHEQQAAAMSPSLQPPDALDPSWRLLLHDEIDRLPQKYRVPVVLCYLHGKTNEEAARDLGWPVGTVKSSLARGREALRRRLERRGVTAGGVVALLGAASVSAAVPPCLARITTQNALMIAAGQAMPGAISDSVALLVEGGLANMTTNKMAAVLCLTLAVLGTGAGVLYLQAVAAPNPRGNGVDSPAPAAARTEPLRFEHTGITISALAFSPDGKSLASGGHDNVVCVFDLATRKKRHEFFGNGGIISTVAFSPDGKTLAVGSRGTEIRLWDVPTGRELGEIKGHQTSVEAIAFSADGKCLVTTGATPNGTIYFWDVSSGKEVRRVSGHEVGTDALVFSSSGSILASTGVDRAKPSLTGRGTVRIWNSADGKLLREWTDIRGGPNVIALSSDGKTLVQGGENAPVRILDVTTGKQLRTIDRLSMVHSLALSPDGKLLVTVSGYQKYVLQIWEVATGTELRRVTPLDSDWSRVAFSCDGKLAWGSGRDITMVLEDGISLAQERLPGSTDVTPKELNILWTDLASTDGRRAFQALGRLRTTPGRTVAFLEQQFRPVRTLPPERLAQLIADLDSDQFPVRERASSELAATGEGAKEVLEKTLAGKPSLEVRRRVQDLLALLDTKTITPQTLRALRAIQLLECLGTEEAQRSLEGLAKGAIDHPITLDAKAALQRAHKGHWKGN